MRPSILFPLFAPATALPGIGARTSKLLEKLCGPHIVDLLWHKPTGLIDRTYKPRIAEAEAGRVATLAVRIAEHIQPQSSRLPYRIIAFDESGQITLSFFNAKGDYLTRLYPANANLLISGRVELYRRELQMPHPDYAVRAEEADKIPAYEPIYSLTEGLSGRQLRRFLEAALTRLSPMPEWLDKQLIQKQQWPSWSEALQYLHCPENSNDLLPENPALQRLAYDELLANQLAMRIYRRHHLRLAGQPLQPTSKLTKALLAALPFELTEAQQRAWQEIKENLASEQLMLRLLQGDVGSGKTIIALLAMLQAKEAGAQAALLAPTEILAKQHHAKLSELVKPLGLEINLLTGKTNAKDKKNINDALAAGDLSLVVGTHALIQHEVNFQNLGLAVIDEQHRFGVQQRALLSSKGRGVNILAMTATPIPRTLALAAYGDMDISVLDAKPPGRKPIDTRVLELNRLDEVAASLKRHVDQGKQAYWVCPLVDESELTDLANVTDRAAYLAEMIGAKHVGLIHGKMPAAERDIVMNRFIERKLHVLVATTVIEVGVDVPNASLMIVEHAERFGLAQLHQLRGRVGRDDNHSICLLLYQGPLGATAKARLTLLRESEDGFKIAEEDLRLRGPGELLGTKQSGAVNYRLADIGAHRELLDLAHDDAKLMLHNDPHLQSERGQTLRILLYLFSYDRAAQLLRGG